MWLILFTPLYGLYPGEKWRNKVFSEGGNIYEATSSIISNTSLKNVCMNHELKEKAKTVDQVLSYGGGVEDLKRLGASILDLNDSELRRIVREWKENNSQIKLFWWELNKAAIKAIDFKLQSRVGLICVRCEDDNLIFTLPSGREIAYLDAKVGFGKYGDESINYLTHDTHGLDRVSTFGAELARDVVKSVSLDLLENTRLQLRRHDIDILKKSGYELVVSSRRRDTTFDEILKIMESPPLWAENLTLCIEAYVRNSEN